MSNKLLYIINWLFGGTFIATIGMWMTEITSGFRFEFWLKNGIGLTVFLLGCFKIYDWIEKKCRRGRRYKKSKR